MKKRVFTFVLVIALAMGATLCSSAAAEIEPRALQVHTSLTFSGTIANCEATVISGTDDLKVTMTLRDGNTIVAMWSDSGTGLVHLLAHRTVTKGKTYTLTVTGTRNGVAFEAHSVTRTC